MRTLAGLLASVAFASILGGPPSPVHAQTDPSQPPLRIGPEANGKDYQPTQAQVNGREKDAGVAPPAAVSSKEDTDLEKIDRMLLDQEHASPPTPPKLTP